MFFFTQIDPRAAIKGSRDPLGFQPVWTGFGRRVVGNLTTVTTSVKNFATLLLGLYFADRVLSSHPFDEEQRAALFLKFEQLAAYCRYAYNKAEGDSAEGLLGIRRVQRRFHEDRGRLRISANREHQILSNQKTYGLWGLYSVAARQSGLLERNENRLTQTALDFVEAEYLPRLSYPGNKNGAEIERFVVKDSWFEPKHKDRKIGKALAELLGPKLTRSERAFYAKTLVLGIEEGCDHTSGMQQQLWEIISEINDSGNFSWHEDFDFHELTECYKLAQARDYGQLAHALEAIHALEPVLAASSRLFGFLLKRNENSLNDVVSEVQSKWGSSLRHIQSAKVEALRYKIESASSAKDSADRIIRLAEALRVGDYLDAIQIAVDQNLEVMKARGGGPWLSIERNCFKVRLKEESGSLPEAEELPALWVNSYFLNSLKTIGRKVMRTSA